MKYSLARHGDGAGDSGPMSCAIYIENEKPVFEHSARPKIGAVMRVGSIYSRSYSMQDYWQTTPIIEIVEDTPDKIVFKTGNSTYTWRQF